MFVQHFQLTLTIPSSDVQLGFNFLVEISRLFKLQLDNVPSIVAKEENCWRSSKYQQKQVYSICRSKALFFGYIISTPKNGYTLRKPNNRKSSLIIGYTGTDTATKKLYITRKEVPMDQNMEQMKYRDLDATFTQQNPLSSSDLSVRIMRRRLLKPRVYQVFVQEFSEQRISCNSESKVFLE